MASIKRDAKALFQNNDKECRGNCNFGRDSLKSSCKFEGRVLHTVWEATRHENNSVEYYYIHNPTYRYAVDCILDDAGVLMPSAEEVITTWSINMWEWTDRIDRFFKEQLGFSIRRRNTFKTCPAYFLAYVKLLRAIEAEEDGVDVDLYVVVESCKPKESTMSQTKTFRVKTGHGTFNFIPNPRGGNLGIEIRTDCSVNGNCYAPEVFDRIMLGMQKARDYQPSEDDIEDV